MPEATWRCPACDTYNGAALRQCDICGTARPAAGAKPAAKPPVKPAAAAASARPAAAAKKMPARAKRKAAPAKPTPAKGTGGAGEGIGVTSGLGPAAIERLRAVYGPPGTPRVSREVAALLPELFHPDGSLRSDGLGADGIPLDFPSELLLPPERRTRPATPDRSASTSPAARPAAARTAPSRTPTAGASTRTGDAAAATARPEITRRDEVIGCSCLFVVVAAIITGIVLLILNWGPVHSFLRHLGHGHGASATGAPRPGGTVPPGTPCPPVLTGLATAFDTRGATLRAVYERADGAEEYTFCRTVKGEVLYFGRSTGESYAGAPVPAKETADGFEVDYPSDGESFRFHGTTVTAYGKGRATWDVKIVSEPGLASPSASPSGSSSASPAAASR